MPGRVFRSKVPEFVDDVALLDSSLFLRKVSKKRPLCPSLGLGL